MFLCFSVFFLLPFQCWCKNAPAMPVGCCAASDLPRKYYSFLQFHVCSGYCRKHIFVFPFSFSRGAGLAQW
ncbi:unnamed protein product [Triticum turgidum subsp. durum]|uniref:Secreted protein n=1 Tax=Triticum turgidum subsp. durum TaxID=4567 RepID=A0A9R1BR97_TRITD|nr:unnamed protein product [Triticum turgidum subsp. durum]